MDWTPRRLLAATAVSGAVLIGGAGYAAAQEGDDSPTTTAPRGRLDVRRLARRPSRTTGPRRPTTRATAAPCRTTGPPTAAARPPGERGGPRTDGRGDCPERDGSDSTDDSDSTDGSTEGSAETEASALVS